MNQALIEAAKEIGFVAVIVLLFAGVMIAWMNWMMKFITKTVCDKFVEVNNQIKTLSQEVSEVRNDITKLLTGLNVIIKKEINGNDKE
jgi:hypothetical protein